MHHCFYSNIEEYPHQTWRFRTRIYLSIYQMPMGDVPPFSSQRFFFDLFSYVFSSASGVWCLMQWYGGIYDLISILVDPCKVQMFPFKTCYLHRNIRSTCHLEGWKVQGSTLCRYSGDFIVRIPFLFLTQSVQQVNTMRMKHWETAAMTTMSM